MIGVSNCPPHCVDCGDQKPAECLDNEGRCGWCADDAEARDLAAQRDQQAIEFRWLSRYWLATRPVLMAHVHELVDQRDAADEIIQAAERARGLLGPAFHAESLLSDVEPIFSAERDNRVSP